jgi:hypothetical protein
MQSLAVKLTLQMREDAGEEVAAARERVRRGLRSLLMNRSLSQLPLNRLGFFLYPTTSLLERVPSDDSDQLLSLHQSKRRRETDPRRPGLDEHDAHAAILHVREEAFRASLRWMRRVARERSAGDPRERVTILMSITDEFMLERLVQTGQYEDRVDSVEEITRKLSRVPGKDCALKRL